MRIGLLKGNRFHRFMRCMVFLLTLSLMLTCTVNVAEGLTPGEVSDVTNQLYSQGYASLTAADSAAAAAGKELVITSNYTISSATTLTSKIKVLSGGGFTKSGSGTVKFAGGLEARCDIQVFTGFGTSDVVFGATQDQVFSKWWGAKGNVATLADGAITTGTATFTSASAQFSASDVGKNIAVTGAGASNTTGSGPARFPLITTIAAYTNATTVTLAANAQATVSGASFIYGTDDTTALQSALNAGTGMTTVFTAGTYFIKSDYTPGLGQRDLGGLTPPANTDLYLMAGTTLQVIPNTAPRYNCISIKNSNITIRGNGALIGDRLWHDYSYITYDPTHEFGYNFGVFCGAYKVRIEGLSASGATGDNIFIGPAQVASPIPDRIQIVNCHLDGARRNNISPVQVYNVSISGGTISNAGISDANHDGVNPKYGIDIESGMTIKPIGIAISGVTFSGNVAGDVSNFDGHQTTVSACNLSNTISYGKASDMSITGNTWDMSASGGLAITGVDVPVTAAYDSTNNITITGNTIRKGGGMQLYGRGIKVIGNRLLETSMGINFVTVDTASADDNYIGWPYTVKSPQTVTGTITNANPAVVTMTGHGYTTGDTVQVTTVTGMWQLKNKITTVTVVDANSFRLDGVNSTSYGAFTGGQITKLANHSQTVLGIAKGTTTLVNVTAHGYTTGEYVRFGTVTGMTQVSTLGYQITVTDADHFILNGVDSTTYGTFTGGTVRDSFGYENNMIGLNFTQTATNVSATNNEIVNAGGGSINSASPSLVLRENRSKYSYKGLTISSGVADLDNNRFDMSLYPSQGAAVTFTGSSNVTGSDNRIIGATNYGVFATNTGGTVLERTTIREQIYTGGGIYCSGAGLFQILDSNVGFNIGSGNASGIVVTGSTNALVAGNKVYNNQPLLLYRAIDTSGSTNGSVYRNSSIGGYGGPINVASTDVLQENSKDGFDQSFVGGSVASAATITPTAKIFHVTGTTTINTINLPYTGWTGQITIIPDGLFVTGTTGNIALATTAVVSKSIIMTYDKGTNKWYPSY